MLKELSKSAGQKITHQQTSITVNDKGLTYLAKEMGHYDSKCTTKIPVRPILDLRLHFCGPECEGWKRCHLLFSVRKPPLASKQKASNQKKIIPSLAVPVRASLPHVF